MEAVLAHEGINSTIAGPAEGVHAVLAYLRRDPRLKDLQHKEAWSAKLPFYRMKVRLKKEIVTMGVPGISPTQMAGTYVKPQDWNALISDPDWAVKVRDGRTSELSDYSPAALAELV